MRQGLGWMFLVCIGLAIPEGVLSGNRPAEFPDPDPDVRREPVSPSRERIRMAVEILGRVPLGRELLQLAESQWSLKSREELLGIFRWASVSKTDAVLTRHFNPLTGKELRERQVTVYLRKDQSLEDLVLDIAHELTHATARPAWDPYDPALTPGRYVWAAIEGEGGEVDALTIECQVSLALAELRGTAPSRCFRYRGEIPGRIEREKVRRDFYRVGRWKDELRQKLGAEITLFPLLSGEAPELYSSTGQAPYPVALLKEFEEITSIACDNSRRRLSSLRARATASERGPRA